MNRQKLWFLVAMLVVLAMSFTACDQLLNPDDNGDNNGALGPVDQALVGTWVMYSSTNQPEEGDYYAGLLVNGDGTGTHYSLFMDNQGGQNPSADPFLWTAQNGVLTVQMSNPEPGTDPNMNVTYSVTENGIRFTINGTNSGGSYTEVYIKMAGEQNASLVGDWIVTSPVDEIGARINLSSGGSGSYTNADNSDVTNFTWMSNGDYIGLLLYNNVAGFVMQFAQVGDQVTLTQGDGSQMVLQRDTGGGGVNTDLVGSWLVYSVEFDDQQMSGSQPGMRSSRFLAGTSEVYYFEMGTLTLNGDGTGSYKMMEGDGEGGETLYESELTWEEIVPGLLSVTETVDGESQTMQIGYTLDGDVFAMNIPEMNGDPAMTQTFIKFADNRPSEYVGRYILASQEIVDGSTPDYWPYIEMTLDLNASDGTMYQHNEYWDDVNQQQVSEETEDNFIWSISDNYFLQVDPTTMLGQVVEFSYEQLSGGSALLTGYTWEYYWDQMNQTEVRMQVASHFYLFDGGHDSGLAGLFVAYGALDASQNQVPGPQMNVSLDPGSGAGHYIGMEWDDQQQQEVLKEMGFDWYTSNDLIIVLPQTDGYPFGQVMGYSLGTNGYLELEGAGPEGDTALLVKKTGAMDADLYGSWTMVGYTENGTSMDVDPNGALEFVDDGTGSHTGTDDDNGTPTLRVDNFTWSVGGDSDKLIVDVAEETDPQVELYMVVEYSINGNLFITTYDRDDMDNINVYVEEYQKQ